MLRLFKRLNKKGSMAAHQLPEVLSSRHAVLELLDGDFQKALASIPPDILAMTEQELNEFRDPTSADYFMRKKLWDTFDKCQALGQTHITAQEIYLGACAMQTFYGRVLTNPHRLAWIFIRPQGYDALIDEAFYYGVQRLRNEMLRMPINEKTMGHFMKAIEFLANRALGPLIQKIESKNLNLNLSPAEAQDPEAIEKKLQELKQKLLNAAKPVAQEPE